MTMVKMPKTFGVNKELFFCRSIQNRQGWERQEWGPSRDDDPQHTSKHEHRLHYSCPIGAFYINSISALSLPDYLQVYNFLSSYPLPSPHSWLLGRNSRPWGTCWTYCWGFGDIHSVHVRWHRVGHVPPHCSEKNIHSKSCHEPIN